MAAIGAAAGAATAAALGAGAAAAAGVVARACTAAAADGVAAAGAADDAAAGLAAGAPAGFAVITGFGADGTGCVACAPARIGKQRTAARAISERDAVRVMTISGNWVNGRALPWESGAAAGTRRFF